MMFVYIFVYKRWMMSDKTYDWKFFLPSNPRASGQGSVPMYQMALFTVGDQLNAALCGPPGAYITVPTQGVLQNLQVVYTAIIAYIFLKTRYFQTHYIGILVLLSAIAVQFGYYITRNDCSNPDPITGDEGGLASGKCFTAYKSGVTDKWTILSTGGMVLW